MSAALWANDNGQVLCADHAGGYLTAAIRERPRARMHRTPLGTWERLTASDIASDPEVMVCETCHPFTR